MPVAALRAFHCISNRVGIRRDNGFAKRNQAIVCRVVLETVYGNHRQHAAVFEWFDVKPTPFHLTSKYEQGVKSAYFTLVIAYGDRLRHKLRDVSASP